MPSAYRRAQSRGVRGGSVRRDPIASNAAVLILNHVVGAIGARVRFFDGGSKPHGRTHQVLALADAMRSGQVGVLLVHDVNPSYTLPPAAGFADALGQVPCVVSFASAADETSVRAHLVLPDHSPLESWGDAEPRPGVRSLLQPTLRPLFDTRSLVDTLLDTGRALGGEAAAALPSGSFRALLEQAWSAEGDFRTALVQGGRFAEAPALAPTLQPGAAQIAIDRKCGRSGGGIFHVDAHEDPASPRFGHQLEHVFQASARIDAQPETRQLDGDVAAQPTRFDLVQRLAQALGWPAAPRINDELCRRHVASFEAALKSGDDVVVACTQEAPLFSELHSELSARGRITFVNIRETAGWSTQARQATPKIAALLALASLPDPEPVPAVTYKSNGSAVIIGPAETALYWAERLADRLEVCVLFTDSGARAELPSERRYPVYSGSVKSVVGYLGNFELSWEQTNPIDLEVCTRCGACIEACPEHAIDYAYQIDLDKCRSHRKCVAACGEIHAIDFTRAARARTDRFDLVHLPIGPDLEDMRRRHIERVVRHVRLVPFGGGAVGQGDLVRQVRHRMAELRKAHGEAGHRIGGA